MILLLLACADTPPLTPTWATEEVECADGALMWTPPTDDLLWVGLYAPDEATPYWSGADGLDAEGNVTARCAGRVVLLYAYM